MNMKPRNAILGPMTILLVEKISGLNWVGSAEAPPEVRAKPIIIIRAAIAMRMKFFFTRGSCEWSSRRIAEAVPEAGSAVVFVGVCAIFRSLSLFAGVSRFSQGRAGFSPTFPGQRRPSVNVLYIVNVRIQFIFVS